MELELRTTIDRRPRVLTWRDGRLSGDEAFLRAVQRFAVLVGVDLDRATQPDLLRVVRHAVAAPVVARAVEPAA